MDSPIFGRQVREKRGLRSDHLEMEKGMITSKSYLLDSFNYQKYAPCHGVCAQTRIVIIITND